MKRKPHRYNYLGYAGYHLRERLGPFHPGTHLNAWNRKHLAKRKRKTASFGENAAWELGEVGGLGDTYEMMARKNNEFWFSY